MAQFESPRFAGNAVLEEILDDPDTGTKKLQKHSDATAVALAQTALYDLVWAQQFPDEDHYPTRARFVDGDYGGTTTKTVEAFKTQYRIVYPPGDPHGFIDGFAGPRTLAALDRQIAYRDRMQSAFTDAMGVLQDAGKPIRFVSIDDEPPPYQPWIGSGRVLRWWTVWGTAETGLETGVMVGSDENGPFELHGPIFRRWYELGGSTGPYGSPQTDVVELDDGIQAVVFENGTISLRPDGTLVEQPQEVAWVPPTGDGVIV